MILYGHTHIPMLEYAKDTLYLNPGSITIPKNDYPPSYVLWDKNKITLYDVNDRILKEILL